MFTTESYDPKTDRRFKEIQRLTEAVKIGPFSMLEAHHDLVELARVANNPLDIDSVRECNVVKAHLWELFDECPYIGLTCTISSYGHTTSYDADYPFIDDYNEGSPSSHLAIPSKFDVKQQSSSNGTTIVPVLVSWALNTKTPQFLFTPLEGCDIQINIPDLN